MSREPPKEESWTFFYILNIGMILLVGIIILIGTIISYSD